MVSSGFPQMQPTSCLQVPNQPLQNSQPPGTSPLTTIGKGNVKKIRKGKRRKKKTLKLVNVAKVLWARIPQWLSPLQLALAIPLVPTLDQAHTQPLTNHILTWTVNSETWISQADRAPLVGTIAPRRMDPLRVRNHGPMLPPAHISHPMPILRQICALQMFYQMPQPDILLLPTVRVNPLTMLRQSQGLLHPSLTVLRHPRMAIHSPLVPELQLPYQVRCLPRPILTQDQEHPPLCQLTRDRDQCLPCQHLLYRPINPRCPMVSLGQ